MKALTIRQQVNRVNKWMDESTSKDIEQGLNWYNEARMLCNQLATKYSVTVVQVAQVISVLSPQKQWHTNKLETIAMFEEVLEGIKPNFGYFATKSTIEECKLIIMGKFLIPSKRIKTYSFADNIANSGSEEVTIDRHALRVAYDDKSAKIDKVSPKQYREAREAYRRVALGHGLNAYQVQAITWVTYKRIVNR